MWIETETYGFEFKVDQPKLSVNIILDKYLYLISCWKTSKHKSHSKT